MCQGLPLGLFVGHGGQGMDGGQVGARLQSGGRGSRPLSFLQGGLQHSLPDSRLGSEPGPTWGCRHHRRNRDGQRLSPWGASGHSSPSLTDQALPQALNRPEQAAHPPYHQVPTWTSDLGATPPDPPARPVLGLQGGREGGIDGGQGACSGVQGQRRALAPRNEVKTSGENSMCGHSGGTVGGPGTWGGQQAREGLARGQ